MSYKVRDIPTNVTVCDLCNEVIPEGTHSLDTASLTHGYIAHKVTERTKRVWFRWPDRDRAGWSRNDEQERQAREMRREWDFHAECVYRVLLAQIEPDSPSPSDPKEEQK